jgi:hypothetical protein
MIQVVLSAGPGLLSGSAEHLQQALQDAHNLGGGSSDGSRDGAQAQPCELPFLGWREALARGESQAQLSAQLQEAVVGGSGGRVIFGAGRAAPD